VFVVVLLDAQNRVLATEELFRGTLTQTSVYPREVVKVALRHNAAAANPGIDAGITQTEQANKGADSREAKRSDLAIP
jgi:hypothetical protein